MMPQTISARKAFIAAALVLCWAGTTCLGASQETARLLITEVSLHRPEFVEIFNPTDQELNLNGLWFCYYPAGRTEWDTPWRSKQFPDQATIRPRGYFLLTLGSDEDGRALLTDWNVYSGMMLNRSGGTVAVLSDVPGEGRVEDAVGWGSALLSFGEATHTIPDGKSLAREWGETEQSPFQDTEDNAADFHSAIPAPSSFRSGITLCAAGEGRTRLDTGNVELSLCNTGPSSSLFSVYATSEIGYSAIVQPDALTLESGECGRLAIQSTTHEYYAIDFETTGLDPGRCSIIEAAWVHVRDGEIVQSDSSLIFTEDDLDPYITKLTGITPDMLEAAPSPDQILPLLLEQLEGMPVLSYSVNGFDRRFLEAAALSLKLEMPDIQWIDGFSWAKEATPDLSSHSLEAVAESFGIVGSHHRALSDSIMTHQVFQEAVRRLGSRICVTIRTEGGELPVGAIVLPVVPF